MKQKIEDLFNLVSNLDIDEETKNYFLEKIWNEDFSEEFFDELEKFLQKDISEKESEISEIWEKISEAEKNFSDEQEKNFEEKKNLLERHQAWLKEIYQESKKGMTEIEWEVDQKVEEISHEKEEDEIDNIKNSLNI